MIAAASLLVITAPARVSEGIAVRYVVPAARLLPIPPNAMIFQLGDDCHALLR